MDADSPTSRWADAGRPLRGHRADLERARWARSTAPTDRESGSDVAVKRLTDARHAARFEIEARLLSQLRHPRVVRVLDYFTTSTGQYLVMELVEGEDLGELLEAARATRACRSTRRSSSRPRGVRGAPVRARAADRPPRREAAEPDPRRRRRRPRRLRRSPARSTDEEDRARSGIGTPRFMAPEVFAGGAVSPRSDVFGLAATLWTLLTGKPPVYADPTKLAELVPGRRARSSRRTIRAGLEMIPERRVASVDAFAKALGSPLSTRRGESLALSVERPDGPRGADGGHRAHRRRRLRGRRLLDRADRPDHRRARLPVRLGRRRARDRRRPAARRASASRAPWSRAARPRRSTLPQRPALRRADRGGHRLRALHDARRPAQARRRARSACSRSSTAATAGSTARRTWSAPTLFAELAVTALDVAARAPSRASARPTRASRGPLGG